MKFAVGFTVSAREERLRALATLAGSNDQAEIRRFVREEAQQAVLDHFARRGVNLRLLVDQSAWQPRGRKLPRLDENSQVVR